MTAEPPSSPSLVITSVELRVRDLAPTTEFYAGKLGFVVVQQSERATQLATEPGAAPILTLTAAPGAGAAPAAAGLFHAALLLPSRRALAAWLRHVAVEKVPLEGLGDHGVSEAVYLSDPEGNGLEFYADRPRERWPFRGDEVAMYTRAVNVPQLLAEPEPPPGTPLLRGARWGHVHLRVTDLDRAEEFYGRELGLAVTQRSFPGARFMAADGYHHHLGLNIWGEPRGAQPDGALGLAGAAVRRRGAAAEELRDPDGIHWRVAPL